MSETYTKLFSSILRSSIWSEDAPTKLVWITMLALADRHGYVGASLSGLAHEARVTVEETSAALAKFMAPDPDSRSQENEGRRVEIADRGWTIINYPRFRDMRDEEARKEYERNRKREQRQRRLVPDMAGQSRPVPEGPVVSAQAEAAAAPEAPEERRASRVRATVDRPEDVSEQVWEDFVEMRRLRRAKVTKTAISRLRAQAVAAGWTLDAALAASVTRGWTGFEADWVKEKTGNFGGKWQKPIEHMRNMPFGTPSCNCADCTKVRAKKEAATP